MWYLVKFNNNGGGGDDNGGGGGDDDDDDDNDNDNNNNNNNNCITLINKTMSSNALKLKCVTAAKWGKPMW